MRFSLTLKFRRCCLSARSAVGASGASPGCVSFGRTSGFAAEVHLATVGLSAVNAAVIGWAEMLLWAIAGSETAGMTVEWSAVDGDCAKAGDAAVCSWDDEVSVCACEVEVVSV